MQQFGSSVQKTITINPKEQQIFDAFLGFVRDRELNTTLRVAGGWVRDKLLGQESHDIDIALDNMMGLQFVTLMNEYLLQKGGEKTCGFGVTKANPDKSKHLETVCVRIFDTWIDVVNLRGETYTEESRIPEMCIGTPLQDAERRDLTINSLYYNINTGVIEDFTGRGLDDLEKGIIRTPLDPTKTFLDDPLRILRTFRFAARFKYTIQAEILEALRHNDIKEKLRLKVSKERVGIEMTKMLQHENIFMALLPIFENQLWDVIFDLQGLKEPISGADRDRLNRESFLTCDFVRQSIQRIDAMKILQARLEAKQIIFYTYLGAICYPFTAVQYKQGKSTAPLSQYILLESLKVPKKEASTTIQLVESAMKFDTLKRQNLEERFDDLVHWIQEAGQMWELSTYLQYCNELIRNPTCSYEQTQFVVDFIHDKQLQNFFDEKPLLNGGEITQLLGVPPGPAIKKILSLILLWQARNRAGTKEELIEYLKKQPL